MKASVEQHIKFKRLKLRLRLPLWQAKGLLESVWNMCAVSSPDGAIGKHSNEDICASIEWDGDPDDLIAVLVDCGWLDECLESRLVVHGWSEHCPQYIKGNLAKHGRSFAVAKQPAKQCAKQPAKQPANDSAEQCARDAATKPSLALPSLTKPSPTLPSKGENPCANDFARFWAAYPKKKSKVTAERAFKKIKGVSIDTIITAVESAKQSPDWMKDNGQFIPHPATWLNQRRWEDEETPIQTGAEQWLAEQESMNAAE